MKICAIVNENAGSAGQAAALVEAAEARAGVACWTSKKQGDGIDLAQQAAEEGYDVVAAAGGDGTVNEVVNGLMRVKGDRPALGLLPLGTGNDLARMLAVPTNDRDAALELLSVGPRRKLDVFVMRSPEGNVYGINVAAGGFSGQVDEALTPEMKASWGPLAYLIGAATVLPDLQDYDTYLTLDDEAPKQLSALNVIVANGRTVAGGKRVAPLANPEDGLLDVVVIRDGSVMELADVATRLVAGNLAASPIVDTYRARRVRAESVPGMWFNLDGELVTRQPVELEVVPASLKVVVGDAYKATVAP